MIVNCYINNMNKIQYEKLKDPHDAPYRENEKQPTHNECADCGETIKPDQWSENNFTLCIDCG